MSEAVPPREDPLSRSKTCEAMLCLLCIYFSRRVKGGSCRPNPIIFSDALPRVRPLLPGRTPRLLWLAPKAKSRLIFFGRTRMAQTSRNSRAGTELEVLRYCLSPAFQLEITTIWV